MRQPRGAMPIFMNTQATIIAFAAATAITAAKFHRTPATIPFSDRLAKPSISSTAKLPSAGRSALNYPQTM